MTDTMALTDSAPEPAPTPRTAKKRRGSTRGASHDAPQSAAVNLLSTWVLEENRVHSLRLRFLAGALGLALLVGLAWTGLNLRISAKESELQDLEVAGAKLQTQITDMAPMRTYASSIKLRSTMVADSMASEVEFSRALSALTDLLPAGTVITTFGGTLTPISATAVPTNDASACPGPDPFGATTIAGCVVLTGTAPSREAVSRLVLTLSSNKLFVEPFITTTTTDDQDVVAFSGSVGLDPRLLTGRFALPETDAAPAETEATP